MDKSKGTNSGQFGLVSDERMKELERRIKAKLNNLNVGFDPEMLALGMEYTAGVLDRGVKKFVDYSKEMVKVFGDTVRPYLKAFYNGARDLPEVKEAGLAEEMDGYDAVNSTDVSLIGRDKKPTLLELAKEKAKEDAVQQGKDEQDKKKKPKEKKETEEPTEEELARLGKAVAEAEEKLFDFLDKPIKAEAGSRAREKEKEEEDVVFKENYKTKAALRDALLKLPLERLEEFNDPDKVPSWLKELKGKVMKSGQRLKDVDYVRVY